MNSGEQAKVSVAIPVHNGANHLVAAIESVRAQTVAPMEIKVFDNASTDATVEIARKLLGNDAVEVSPSNAGAVENFNKSARGTSGDYFMWLAVDDRIRPTFIETCVRALEASPDAPACLTGIQFTDSMGGFTRQQTDGDLAAPDPRTRLRSFVRRRRWTETYCLYRRDRLIESPLFVAEYGADVMLSWWFLLRGPLAVSTDILLEYREYPEKTIAETAQAVDPNAPVVHWQMPRLWRRLWAMTHEPDIDRGAGRTARRELLLLATYPGVVFHIVGDTTARWPLVNRVVRWVWDRVGSPGKLSPER